MRSPLTLIRHKDGDYSILYKHCCLAAYNSSLRAVGQAVSRRPLAAEARVPCRSSPCGGFVVEKVALGQILFRGLRLSSVSIIPPMLHTHTCIYQRWYVILAIKECR